MSSTMQYIGVDVAKSRLDIALRPALQSWRLANDDAGIGQFLQLLQQLSVAVVVEATGGYQVAVSCALAAAGLPVVVVNPHQVRDFARASGRLAKTDAIDASVLAHFAEAIKPAPRPLPDAQAQALAVLLARRR